MSRTPISLLVVALFLTASSCHAKFKKFARTADVVEMKAVVSASPTVDLYESGGNRTGTVGEAIFDQAVGTAAQMEGSKVAARLRNVMSADEVREMVQTEAVTLLGDGPPFGTQGTPIDGTIQIELTSYGIQQQGGGPNFFANYLIRGYRASDSKRIYKTSASCSDQAFTVPNTPGNLLGSALTVKRLEEMSDDELRAAVEQVVRRCTGHIIARMRDHAG